MATYILDTDTSKTDGVTTFSVFADLLTRIETVHTPNFTTPVVVYLRASTGLPLNQNFTINKFVPTAVNNLTFIAQTVNGFPFKITETGLTSSYVCDLNDDHITLKGENFGDLWIEADTGSATDKILIAIQKATCLLKNAIIYGKSSARHGGVFSGSSGANVEDTLIIGCNRQFYGASRGVINYTRCTFVNNTIIRGAGNVNNCIFKATPHTGGDGINGGAASNNNIYDVPKSALVYRSGTDAATADANSIFSYNPATTLALRSDGGYDLMSGSSSATLMASAGQIGAGTVIINGNVAPVIAAKSFDVLVGAQLVIDLTNAATDANGDALTYIVEGDDVIQGADEFEYIFTSIVPGPHLINVTADDGKGGISTTVYTINVNTPERQPTKVLTMGNSLSGVPAGDPSGVTKTVYDEVQQIMLEKNRLFSFTQYRYGGRALKDHVADQVLMADIPNHDLVLIQGGTGDNANYTTDVTPITNISKSAAIWLRWERAGAPGEYAQLKANLTAAANATSSGLIQMGDVWQDLRANTAIDLFYDMTHQNLNGSYVNALSIYRYLTGESVMDVVYKPELLTLSDADIALVKASVDTNITQFYSATTRTATVTITTSPTTVTQGNSANFRALATDTVTGDLTSSIVWVDDLGNTLGTGGNITIALANSGNRTFSAKVVGSDGKTTYASKVVTVTPAVNTAPTANNLVFHVIYNEAFTQKSLTAFVSDDGIVNWSTLNITQPTRGIATIDANSPSTVNLNYSGTNFVGVEEFFYSVADTSGLRSAQGKITVVVSKVVGADIVGKKITRGQAITIQMTNYTPSYGVEVYIKDLLTNVDYSCDVISNTSSGIDIVAPSSMPTVANAQVIIKPIVAVE